MVDNGTVRALSLQSLPSLDAFKDKVLIVRLRRMETLLDEQEANPQPKRTAGPKSKRKKSSFEEDDELLRLLEDPVRRRVLRADLDRSKRRGQAKSRESSSSHKNGKSLMEIFSDDSNDDDQPAPVEISDTEMKNTGGPSRYAGFCSV